MTNVVAVLAGDGIGPEIVEQAVRVLNLLDNNIIIKNALVGGAAFDQFEHPLPTETLDLANNSDAVLFGAVGDWKYDSLPRELRPEQSILGLRKSLGLFANLRPAFLYSDLANASTLKPEVVSGLDLLIVRELTGDVYFGQPRGTRVSKDGHFVGEKEGFDTMRYSESEIRRIAHIAFQSAQKRKKKLCSVDKANVLETSQFWRDIVIDVSKEYKDVELTHMYIDNAAMQLVKNPCQFDVIVTGNLFGDILSDEAAMLTGSIGMLPSASLNSKNQGLYEPSHGSAPDIAGKNIANPIATILSAAMLLRYSLNMPVQADLINTAVESVLAKGFRTSDIFEQGMVKVSTSEMGDEILKELNRKI
ncbi:3-isopropylmalate dehydrogenase [Candidatus Kinetoplastidibacterium crithidiae]|uniref:3-isopropylmalate dehydrogenase n=1 Tax=Candidatus Kinetoplastidibacterium crithidiae TCC036E TaxID=1208918 RepID=M1LTS7_9PROT|nr:3-isopropylmalate dehydrogenase [Candidatus Kinetoplastibacterium crithidii]AFZ82836.1 3-isopropylmalate dehydrogenase [Candidatus Kinetoplastibacterium crithidii (ex Angomonas deanei ATCC 30255)]AGF47511.1 3-isopropylmalate dehydrogenase [Candidatus Kinetoplastibacterium crithidii TCC036E]